MISPDNILNITKGRKESDDLPEWEPFYSIKIMGSGDNPVKTIKINYLMLVKRLKKLGFCRMDINKNSFIVHIDKNVVQEVTPQQVVDSFIDYIEQYPLNLGNDEGVMRDQLINKIYGSIGTYFSEKILYRMRSDKPIVFNEDSKDESFFYYRNGYVRVTQHTIKLLPYDKLDKMIWKNQILDRDFKLVKPEKYRDFSFFLFCNNISDNYINKQSTKRNDPERFNSFETLIGYNLHKFYQRKLQATILTDSRESEEASGRTGKTLVTKAMGKMLNSTDESQTFVELNGKDFDMSDKFKYQELSLETRLVHLNDVKRYFPFDSLFNDITEGIKCQRKNENPFRVATKIVLSTNQTIKIHGDSAKDRSIEFELADYYSANYSPDKEFKEWFFSDWDDKSWNCFDSFMLHCVQRYLKTGLLRPNSINLNSRKLRTETHEYFIEFMEDLRIVSERKYDKADLFRKFYTVQNQQQFPKLKPNSFTKWMKLFGEYRQEFEKVSEGKSNGMRYIQFIKKSEYLTKEDENPNDELPL